MQSKNELQKKHARKRFNTRTGIVLTQDLHKCLVQKIQKGQAQRVEKQSNRVSIWDINVEDKDFRVVYDSNTKNIVTVLHKDGSII